MGSQPEKGVWHVNTGTSRLCFPVTFIRENTSIYRNEPSLGSGVPDCKSITL